MKKSSYFFKKAKKLADKINELHEKGWLIFDEEIRTVEVPFIFETDFTEQCIATRLSVNSCAIWLDNNPDEEDFNSFKSQLEKLKAIHPDNLVSILEIIKK